MAATIVVESMAMKSDDCYDDTRASMVAMMSTMV